jgi:hypothetical protein
MSTRSEFDRLASAWLSDGPTELTDRVLDAALHEVHVTHQRRRPAPWRTFPMSFLPVGLAGRAIAVVVVAAVALGGAAFLSSRGETVGNPTPTSGSSAIPTPSAFPTSSAISTRPTSSAGSSATIPRGPLAGTYTTTIFTPAVTFTVEAGWSNKLEGADDFNLWMGDGVHQLTIARVAGDPIRHARPNPDFTIGAPVATTIAGLPAQEISLVLSPTARNSGEGFALGSFALLFDRNPLAIQHAGSTSRLITLQVDGQQVVIVAERPTDDTGTFDQQVQAILASMSFN